MNKKILFFVLAVFLTPVLASAQITSLGGQTGATQTFGNDTNVTITSSSNNHALGWSGILAPARGGTGADVGSFSSGSVLFNDSGIVGGESIFRFDMSPSPYFFPTLFLGEAGDDFFIKVPDATISNTAGGNLHIRGSEGLGTESGGHIDMIAGGGGSTGPGGDVNLDAADGGATSGNGGVVGIMSGAAIGEGDGGLVHIDAGPGGFTSGKGGIITIIAGNARADDNDGGDIILTAGNSIDEGVPGNIFLNPGNNSSLMGKVYIGNSVEATNAALDVSLLAVDQTFTFPNYSGTFSLLESSNIFTNPVNKFVSGSDSTVHIGANGIPGCIVMGDSDGSGVTYITANNGSLSASSSPGADCN